MDAIDSEKFIIQRNERALAEVKVMLERAIPILDIWDVARGEPDISKEDIAKLYNIWICGVVGISPELEQWKSKNQLTITEAIQNCPSRICPQIGLSDRLFTLSREANANQEKPLGDPVRRAAEDGFLILARRWIERGVTLIEKGIAIGYSRSDVTDEIFRFAKASDKPSAFTTRIMNLVGILCKEIDKNGVFRQQDIREMIELYTRLDSIENRRKVKELKKKLDNLQSANKDGIKVDAPKFERRPVPGEATQTTKIRSR